MADFTSEPVLPVTDFIIQGMTNAGKIFRPSDWADRLCGIMARFHPDGDNGRNRHLQYSPYVLPSMIEGLRCVMVDGRLRTLEPLAYHFLLDFAKDNDLRIIDACLLPESATRAG